MVSGGYAHDAAGQKSGESYPSALVLTYSYSDIGLLEQIDEGSTTLAAWSHVGSRPHAASFQNGTTLSVSYTGFRGEIQGLHHQDSSLATIVNLQYGYDDNHDRVYERFGAAGSSGDAYAYDGLRRLAQTWLGSTKPEAPIGSTFNKLVAYGMDDDGNRTLMVATPGSGSPTSTAYTTNADNQYTTVGGTNQAHDANGNLKDDGTHLFAYDYRNQLVEVRVKATDTEAGNVSPDSQPRAGRLASRPIKTIVAPWVASRP